MPEEHKKYCEACGETRPAEKALRVYCEKHLKEAIEKFERTEESMEDRFFGKGYYTFRFEFTDKDGKQRYSINSWNDGMSREEALKNVYRFVDEHKGKLTDFVENEWFKSFIKQEIDMAVAKERERLVEKLKENLIVEINPSNEDQRDWYRGLGREEAQREMREKAIRLISEKICLNNVKGVKR
jgi:hypothetical protein